MDDIDGWPEVTGGRIGHDDDAQWRVTLTPDGLRMEGPERTATVGLGTVYAVRHRTGVATEFESSPGSVFEVGWVTVLGEERTLSLRCDDQAQAQRLAQVIRGALRELDAESGRQRGIDWVLIVLLAMGAALAIRDLSEAAPPQGTYDWTAALINVVATVFTVPVLYLLVRGAVRWTRGRARK